MISKTCLVCCPLVTRSNSRPFNSPTHDFIVTSRTIFFTLNGYKLNEKWKVYSETDEKGDHKVKKYLNKVLIVDGSYMLHRALHASGLEDLQTSAGVKSGGVFGFLRTLQAEVKKFPGYFPVVTWDKGLSERRTALYPEYKANRQRRSADSLIATGVETLPDDYLEEYHRQRKDTIKILKSLGIPSLLIPGWEGDDLMYLLSKVTEDGVIVSDDKDMIQLVSPTIRIRRSLRDEIISWEGSDPYYHHPHFTIVKSIIGDGSDNIPQVAAGLGVKGADQIASIIDSVPFDQYKSTLEKYLEENIKGAIVKKIRGLLDNWNQFIINYNLIDLHLVEAPAGFEMMIKDLIKGVVGKSKLMEAYSLIGQYEMSTIYPDQIIFALSTASAQVLK